MNFAQSRNSVMSTQSYMGNRLSIIDDASDVREVGLGPVSMRQLGQLTRSAREGGASAVFRYQVFVRPHCYAHK